MPKRVEPGTILSDQEIERLYMEREIVGNPCHSCGGCGLTRAVVPMELDSPTGRYSCYYAGVCVNCDGTGQEPRNASHWLVWASIYGLGFWGLIWMIVK